MMRTVGDINLVAEWLGLPDVNSVQLAELAALGVDRRTLDLAGGMSWCRIWPTGRTWQPSPAGEVYLILPIWNGRAPSLHRGVEHPELNDLLAFRLDAPTRWHRRLAAPGAVLGAEAFEIAHVEGIPLPLFPTPIAWLEGGCRGAVLLDEVETAWEAREERARIARDAIYFNGGRAA